MPPKYIVPPLNFSMVAPKIYRSGCPNKKNYEFLRKIQLKTIIYLCADEYSQENLEFLESNNIQIYKYEIVGNKEPFTEINQKDISDALRIVLDTRNHPVLIHCNKGKHRVGCLVGVLRKLQNWCMTSIFDEYRRFAGTRIADQSFIEVFDEPVDYDPKYAPKWLLSV